MVSGNVSLDDYVDLEELAIKFECIDCGENIVRAPHQWDIPGLMPRRCSTCALVAMGRK